MYKHGINNIKLVTAKPNIEYALNDIDQCILRIYCTFSCARYDGCGTVTIVHVRKVQDDGDCIRFVPRRWMRERVTREVAVHTLVSVVLFVILVIRVGA